MTLARKALLLLAPLLIAVTTHGQSPSYLREIAPILNESCIECHGSNKQKGDIRLDSADHLRDAIREKSIIVQGEPERSAFYKRTVLHPDDDDRMPPKDQKPPLSKEQTTLIWVWIREGADFGDGKSFLPSSGSPTAVVKRDLGPTAAPRMPIDAEMRNALQPHHVVVTAYGHYGHGVSLRFVNPNQFETAFQQLAPYADKIWHLDLSRQAAGKPHLESLLSYPKLTRLDLRENTYTVDELLLLKQIKTLTWLNLSGAKIDGDLNKLKDALNPNVTLFLP